MSFSYSTHAMIYASISWFFFHSHIYSSSSFLCFLLVQDLFFIYCISSSASLLIISRISSVAFPTISCIWAWSMILPCSYTSFSIAHRTIWSSSFWHSLSNMSPKFSSIYGLYFSFHIFKFLSKKYTFMLQWNFLKFRYHEQAFFYWLMKLGYMNRKVSLLVR